MKIVNNSNNLTDELLKELVNGNANISMIVDSDLSDDIIIPINDFKKSEEDEECSLSKCSSCIHNGLCDLQDELEYEN